VTGQHGPGRRAVVIGVGNEYRRDDGAGPEVIAALRALQPDDADLSGVTLAVSDGEPSRMMDLWEGAGLAVVIDAVRASATPPGHLYQLAIDALPGTPNTEDGGARPYSDASSHSGASSHSIGLADTLELARVLGRLPARLTVLAVVGRDFGFGAGLSAEVAAAVAELVEQVRELVR
jgi:hydrogenase maturation protease